MAKPGSSERCKSKIRPPETDAPFGLRCNLKAGHEKTPEGPVEHQARRMDGMVRWS